jgi:hypothetical protein
LQALTSGEDLKMETIKWRLSNALRDINTLPNWEALVSKVHKVTTTAALFTRYCFVRALAENPAFDLKVHFEKEIFFTEIMKTFVDKQRGTARTDDTQIVRQTINNYLPDFLNLYQYQKETIPGLQSNLFQYTGSALRTCYLNNIQTRLSKHLTKTINSLLCVKILRKQLRDRQTSEDTKSDIRKFLQDVSYFKSEIVDKLPYHQIISETDQIGEVNEVMLELEDMGMEFVEALRCIAGVLKAADHGNYHRDSLTIDITEHPERHLQTMYELSQVNERMGFSAFQCFPIKRSFIPSSIPLDIGIVASHISGVNNAQLKEIRQNIAGFWHGIFKTEHQVFKQSNKEYTGWMQTDGVALCVLRTKNGIRTQSHARKRKRGESASEKRERIYRDIAELPADELPPKESCVLIDPNRRDILFAMHESSTPENPRLYRYTSMSRRRYSGTKAARRRQEREVANDPLVRAALVTLSETTYMSTSRGTYEAYLLARSAATPTLDEFYSREIFRKLRWRCFMRRKQHEDRLVNALRTKFENAVLVFGDANIGNSKFHSPTPCLGIRDLLQRKGFEILLLNEFRTSSFCPICKCQVKAFKHRLSPRPWRRDDPPRLVHGLLRCQSNQCRQILNGKDRLWNRDLLATLNFRAILEGLRSGSGRPVYLSR